MHCCCQPQQTLLVLSIHGTCFSHTDHPQHNFKIQNKMHIYFIFILSFKIMHSIQGEVNSVKNTITNIWLNNGVYWQ